MHLCSLVCIRRYLGLESLACAILGKIGARALQARAPFPSVYLTNHTTHNPARAGEPPREG